MHDLYKSLRRRLRKFALIPSLLSIYNLVQYLQFDMPLPENLRFPGYGQKGPAQTGLYEWTIELIAQELIINAPDTSYIALSHWNDIASVGNLVNRIENELWGSLPDRSHLIRYEMVRIAHRQFPWQIGVTDRFISRYFKLYSNPRLNSLIQAEFGMSALELFQVMLALAGHFVANPFIQLPMKNDVNKVDNQALDHLVCRISCPLIELREKMLLSRDFNTNWAYTFNPLRSSPLIRVGQNEIFCPLPTLFIWRLTDSIYFDLVKHNEVFSKYFGPAFQDLVGEVLRAANSYGHLKISGEQRYGTRRKPRDTADWIVEDDTATIIIECKSNRLNLSAKVDLHDTSAIDTEIERLANIIIQLYCTIADALDGMYPQWQPTARNTYPLVVTLGEWLPSGQTLGALSAAVESGLAKRGLPQDFVSSYPFTLCSLHEFEALATTVAVHSIQTVMGEKTAPDKKTWAVFPFLHSQFPSAPRFLFEREWNELTESMDW